MIKETLKQIIGDSKPETDLTWQQILGLLGCDFCTFPDSAEEKLAFDFMFSLIESRGPEWVSEHRGQVMADWEQQKIEYRQQRIAEQRKRKQKRQGGILAKIFNKKKQL